MTAAVAREGVRMPQYAMSDFVLAAEDERRPAFTMRMLYAPLVAPSMQNGVMVAHHALDKINLEVSKARRDGPLLACTGYHGAVLGLPCAHLVRQKIAAREPLLPSDVARRWHLFDVLAMPPAPMPPVITGNPMHIANPHKVRSRGRPTAKSAGPSTRRDPSQFELADPPASQGAQRCGVCRQAGHNARSCSNLSAAASASRPGHHAGSASQTLGPAASQGLVASQTL